uniref:Uncharacterized protein LOC114346823 n=1 Tax=Diabrotica virgifera virgifera TaxID=50390 RepID=A0A6P7HC57_DIAVI
MVSVMIFVFSKYEVPLFNLFLDILVFILDFRFIINSQVTFEELQRLSCLATALVIMADGVTGRVVTRSTSECPIFGAPSELKSTVLPTIGDIIKGYLYIKHK